MTLMRVDALHAILILPGTQENLVLVKTMFTENILTLCFKCEL